MSRVNQLPEIINIDDEGHIEDHEVIHETLKSQDALISDIQLSVAGIQGTMSSKADAEHTHSWSSITDKPEDLVDLETLDETIEAEIKQLGFYRVKDFGAVGNGIADDYEAIMDAIEAAHTAGGGTVYFAPGTYKISAPIGSEEDTYGKIRLTSDSYTGAKILCDDEFPALIGAWYRSDISNLEFNAGGHGAPAANIHMAEAIVRDCLFDGWTGHGVKLNDGTYGDVGLLNKFERNHIVQNTGAGILQTYRWVDSWVKDNNVGSTAENISLEGGPVRVSGNHFNGAPEYNIVLRGNKRVTIIDNICEGSRKEAIVYDMPSWLNEDDPQLVIANNNISNGGKLSAHTYPAINIIGKGDDGVSSIVVTGNIIACEDAGSGWSNAVSITKGSYISILGNIWEKGYLTAPVSKTSSSNISVTGNTSGNDETGGSQDAADITGSFTDQVDASAAMVTTNHPLMGGEDWVVSASELAYGILNGLVELAGKADAEHTHTISQVSGLETAMSAKADLVGGVIPTSQIPAVALTKPFPVANRAAMLALSAQEGDFAIITGTADKGSYVLGSGPSNQFSSWFLLSSPESAVQSVNGQIGSIVLGAADVGAAPASHSHTISNISGLQSALDSKSATSHTHTAENISNSTTVGRALMTASTEASARSAIGAGTSNLTIGTTSSTAKAGDYQPTWGQVSGKPTTFTPATHTHTKSEVGLGNVDNTSDLNKPVSTATQAAINAKIQLVSDFPASPVTGVLYLKAE